MRRWVLAWLLLWPCAALADEAQTDQLCAQVAHVEPPAADQPTPSQIKALAGCDAEALYYGIGRPVDFVGARLCAFAQELDDPSPAINEGPTGNAMLMMIYAYGQGVRRNPALARKLACQLPLRESDHELVVGDVAGLDPDSRPLYDFCGDVSSRLPLDGCAVLHERLARMRTEAALAVDRAALPVMARHEFDMLRKRAEAWADARAAGEVDGDGEVGYTEVTGEKIVQWVDFCQMLERLRKGRPPHLGQAELDRANARMNAALRRLQMAAPTQSEAIKRELNTITWESIKATQSKWLAYRDAWGRFAAVTYPALGTVGAQAWVTMKRADMLERQRVLTPDGFDIPH